MPSDDYADVADVGNKANDALCDGDGEAGHHMYATEYDGVAAGCC